MKGALFRSCLLVRFVANFFSKSKTADAGLGLNFENTREFFPNTGLLYKKVVYSNKDMCLQTGELKLPMSVLAFIL
ncbi:MAG: hypothetical protein LBI90_05665, partial [Treponema sp.]|nr:hypothetical protein [Treponema sp.]